MPAVWSEDPTIGNALAGVADAMYGGPMLQLRATEIAQGIRQRNLEYQRLQQQMALQQQQLQWQREMGDLSTQMLGPASGAGSGAQDASTGADFRGPMADYYSKAIRLALSNGNVGEAEQLRQFGASLLHDDYGARTPAEAYLYHAAFTNPKGPEAMGLSNSLEGVVAKGGPLTPAQAQFMARYVDAISPLTAANDGRFVRGALPITPAMFQELARNGVNLGGFPAISMPGQETPGGDQGAAPSAPRPQLAGGPQWDLSGTPAAKILQQQEQRKVLEQHPSYQNALETTNAARNLITALQSRSVAGDRAALQLYARTFLANARTQGAGEEQIKDMTSQFQQWMAGWEKAFEHGDTLPNSGSGSRLDLASNAAHFAANAKDVYDKGPGATATRDARGLGLDPAQAVPIVEGLPNFDQGGNGREPTFQWIQPQVGQQPATPPQTGARPGAIDILKDIGVTR